MKKKTLKQRQPGRCIRVSDAEWDTWKKYAAGNGWSVTYFLRRMANDAILADERILANARRR